MRRDIALLANPGSGRGRGGTLLGPVVERLGARGVAVRVLTAGSAAAATELAAKAVADGVDALVALGGDGTAHLALQAVAGTTTPLALVPAGTGNDLAVALGLPADPLAACELVVDGSVREVDAALATGPALPTTWWAGVMSAGGFDSAVTERANRMRWPAGPRKYDLAILAELRVVTPVPLRLRLDERELEVEALLLAIGNSTSYGAGMRITPRAELDDGLLDVTVIGPMSRLRLARFFRTVYDGSHLDNPAVTSHRASTVEVSSPRPHRVAYADGERLGPLPVRAECRPGALRVLVP